MTDLLSRAIRWRDMDPDPDTREQLDHLIVQAQANDETFRAAAEDELALAFAGPLEFGTAGRSAPAPPA